MDDLYLSTLKKYWGYDNFRGIQRDIIESIGSRKDTLGLMPTGGGKSITFQVPALSQDGICISVFYGTNPICMYEVVLGQNREEQRDR